MYTIRNLSYPDFAQLATMNQKKDEGYGRVCLSMTGAGLYKRSVYFVFSNTITNNSFFNLQWGKRTKRQM